ncbi:MAG: sigma-70 family RNA polymerase sigma factor [Verrucomicrobia bacterium]|nr:MAG: sigma-70 family RNA polymerase sigma factor [Verrucomicrobiota bacterium]
MEFPETNWAALAEATLHGGPKEQAAMEELCRGYWQPVCAVIRARGAPSERVEDLTQEFFLQLIQRSSFKKANPEKGRFRSYLLGALRYFLADDAAHHAAQKRGGAWMRCELLEDAAMTEVIDQHFDRAWAETLLERALVNVQAECVAARGPETWQLLRGFLPGATAAISYGDLAAQMKTTEGGAKSEVHRLRLRYRSALRLAVAHTVSAPHEIDEELSHLREVLRDGGSQF